MLDETGYFTVARVRLDDLPKRRPKNLPPEVRPEDQDEFTRLYWDAVIDCLREKRAEGARILAARKAAEANAPDGPLAQTGQADLAGLGDDPNPRGR